MWAIVEGIKAAATARMEVLITRVILIYISGNTWDSTVVLGIFGWIFGYPSRLLQSRQKKNRYASKI